MTQSGQFLQAANDAGVRSRPLRGFLAGIPSEGKAVDALGVCLQRRGRSRDAPHIAVANDVISIIRHRLLLKVLVWDT